jgi:hypothetical protein
MLYECHITLSVDDAEKATHVAKEFHWKTSEIARDPVLGNATYFYLTTHTNDFPQMWEKMKTATAALEGFGVNVIREKIELIIHDTKVKV